MSRSPMIFLRRTFRSISKKWVSDLNRIFAQIITGQIRSHLQLFSFPRKSSQIGHSLILRRGLAGFIPNFFVPCLRKISWKAFSTDSLSGNFDKTTSKCCLVVGVVFRNITNWLLDSLMNNLIKIGSLKWTLLIYLLFLVRLIDY